MRFAKNAQASWQEEYCFVMTMPESIHPEQPRREFKNYSGKFLNMSNSLDLAPSDFRLFGPLQNHLGGKCFAEDEKGETEVRKWLRQRQEDFYVAGFGALLKRWDKYINVVG
jgi:hypothetical protein